jgi:hypothetical protein
VRTRSLTDPNQNSVISVAFSPNGTTTGHRRFGWQHLPMEYQLILIGRRHERGTDR